jgi:hypothetical protein
MWKLYVGVLDLAFWPGNVARAIGDVRLWKSGDRAWKSLTRRMERDLYIGSVWSFQSENHNSNFHPLTPNFSFFSPPESAIPTRCQIVASESTTRYPAPLFFTDARPVPDIHNYHAYDLSQTFCPQRTSRNSGIRWQAKLFDAFRKILWIVQSFMTNSNITRLWHHGISFEIKHNHIIWSLFVCECRWYRLFVNLCLHVISSSSSRLLNFGLERWSNCLNLNRLHYGAWIECTPLAVNGVILQTIRKCFWTLRTREQNHVAEAEVRKVALNLKQFSLWRRIIWRGSRDDENRQMLHIC